MAKRKIIWSVPAKCDLLEILTFYFSRNGTKIFSRKLNLSLRKTIKLLEKNPDIGIQTNHQNIRNLVHDNYYIIYKVNPDTIEILAIWDSRQNPDDLKIKY